MPSWSSTKAARVSGQASSSRDPGSTFYMAPAMDKSICDPDGCPHGYAFTPFSNEHNYYRTDLGLNEKEELSHVNVESFTSSDEGQPYFYLSGRFDPLTLNDDSQMINGTALHMEAVFRTFSLANSFGLESKVPIYQKGPKINLRAEALASPTRH